ncbi:MAG: hypothetical protein R2771_10445 [Saprospiraceae bacterium]
MRFSFAFIFVLFIQNILFSQITVNNLFSDHMVLQRGKMIPINGTSKAKTKIFIDFNSKTYSTKSDKSGNWSLIIDSQNEGGPFEMKIYDKKSSIIIRDILVGDVWIAGGQSNMEWFVEGSNNSETEIANANYPEIRILDINMK